ncbi:MAG: histidinol-phosphatase [Oscillospiraceae bacterium]|nr:histidinol-phosphatase [Oscillospiraceae bacterium]
MLCNLHTHTNFSDGANSAEEVVLAALEQGFTSLGFSDHGHTAFDMRYCIQDDDAYRAEILRLKQAYAKDIEIYLGLEEEAASPIDRTQYDYIIGSMHYVQKDGQYYTVDANPELFAETIGAFGGDAMAFAHAYYGGLCEYLRRRKPDIVGHFDLLTKFEETDAAVFFENSQYREAAKRYMRQAVQTGCLFEVNTGAMSRGYRTSPYPHEDLLYILRESGNGIVLSSDSHAASTLAHAFEQTKLFLKDMKFTHTYVLRNGAFVKEAL